MSGRGSGEKRSVSCSVRAGKQRETQTHGAQKGHLREGGGREGADSGFR